MKSIFLVGVAMLLAESLAQADQPWVVYEGHDGPGKGKKIVFVSGDEEYRSEEGLPQLAKILAVRHGFHCTVLFAVDPKDGTINPNQSDNIPGLEALDSANLMVILTRFRDLPDDQMQHIVNYVESGKPIVALRTSTHAFALQKHKTFSRYDWQSKEWDGGFGRHVLGETWINHHGHHGKQSTLGLVAHRDEGASDLTRHSRRRHLGADRRLRDSPSDACQLPNAGAGRGAQRHAPD